jgi:hypothetical protein
MPFILTKAWLASALIKISKLFPLYMANDEALTSPAKAADQLVEDETTTGMLDSDCFAGLLSGPGEL